jgi:hypothetical protein
VLFVLVFALGVSGCSGGGDDDDTAGVVTPAVTMTPAGNAPEPGGGATVRVGVTSTSVAPTATSEPSEATEQPTETAIALATATEELRAEATATEGPAALGEVTPLDPEALPNFTMTMMMDMRGIPDSEDANVEFDVRQSSVENYYVRIDSEGAVLESWLVDGTNYVRQEDGTLVEVPGAVEAGLVSPGMFVSTVPSLEAEVEAYRVGEDEVSGRDTTHYRIPGEELLSMSGFLGDNPDISDVEGEADVWIDDELNILIKQTADITWTNGDGSDGALQYDYLIDDIGSTARIDAPQ